MSKVEANEWTEDCRDSSERLVAVGTRWWEGLLKSVSHYSLYVCVWNACFLCSCVLLKNSGFYALFIKPISTFFRKKKNFKTRFYGIIHTFKNYFIRVFLVFNNKQYLNKFISHRLIYEIVHKTLGKWERVVMV